MLSGRDMFQAIYDDVAATMAAYNVERLDHTIALVLAALHGVTACQNTKSELEMILGGSEPQDVAPARLV